MTPKPCPNWLHTTPATKRPKYHNYCYFCGQELPAPSPVD